MTSLSQFLRISTPQEEGVLRVSKWLKYQVLLSSDEMRELCAALDPFSIYSVSGVVKASETLITQNTFLEKYSAYVQALQSGQIPQEKELKPFFSSVFTASADILYAMQVGDDKFLIKAIKPVVQLQAHHFFVSSVDGKFHSMVLSDESITWGIQFSYPQIFQDPKTHAFSKVAQTEEFPNSVLFLRLAKWLRHNTLPTPFIHEGKRTNVPMRLGKKCLAWIHNHPGLAKQDLRVHHAR